MSSSQPATSGDTSSKETITTGDTFRDATATISIFIEPPYFDSSYARVVIDDGSSSHPTRVTVESKSEAEAHIKDRFAALEDHSEKPTPTLDNTHLFVYPHYEDEFTVPELFGNQSLSAFTADNDETPIEAAGNWYALTNAYQNWVKPILDPDADDVLTYTTKRHSSWTTYWVRATDAGVEWITHDTKFHSWTGPETAHLTKVVRAIGAHGLIYPALPDAGEDASNESVSIEVSIPDGERTTGTIGTAILPEAETPFADDYEHPYLEATGHPTEVNGWSFNPDAAGKDGWQNPDGSVTVQVRNDTVRITHDDLTQDLSSDHIVTPEASPAPGEDSQLTRSQLRTVATDWMKANPADEWQHPLARSVDAITSHRAVTTPHVSARLREAHGELRVKIEPTEDGPFGPEEDLYCYIFDVRGDIRPDANIPPENTTGFTTTHVTGTAPGAGNISRTEVATGSLIHALETTASQLRETTDIENPF
jgi:hypothetical protein